MHSNIDCICLTFSNVHFQMFQMSLDHTQANSHWLHLLDFSSLCVFKCVLKELGSAQANSHWLHFFTYIHCAFSNMSSNCLPENRHIHIWMHSFGFFQRVFLNGCSQHLHKKMRCRNDCICFTFLHCAFSNVSSNTQSPRDCIVTLVALWDSTSR